MVGLYKPQKLKGYLLSYYSKEHNSRTQIQLSGNKGRREGPSAGDRKHPASKIVFPGFKVSKFMV